MMTRDEKQRWQMGMRDMGLVLMLLLAALPCRLLEAESMKPADIEPSLDWPMDWQPALPMRKGTSFVDPKLRDLWSLALDRPDTLTRVQAATAIAKAYDMGCREMLQTVPKLLALLKEPRGHPLVRVAVAQALVQMDVREAAAVFLEQNSAGNLDMVLVTDPALAAWNNEAARKIWRQRLEGNKLESAAMLSAIRSLGVVGDASSVELMLAIAENHQLDAGQRIEAAKSIRMIGSPHATASAGRLLTATGSVTTQGPAMLLDRLVAVHLLCAAPAEDAKALQLLEQLLTTPRLDSAIGKIALARLIQIAPQTALKLAGNLSRSDDSDLRGMCAALWATHASEDAIKGLALLLGDSHADVRRTAREAVMRMSSDEQLPPALAEAIKRAVLATLSASNALAAEQGALLCRELKLTQGTDDLLKLMTHSQPAVRLAAVTALRHFLPQEKILAAFGDRAKTLQQTKNVPGAGADAELAQIFQGLGQVRDESSQALFVKMIPKNTGPGNLSRAAAIWALGRVLEGKPNATLAPLLVERINDVDLMVFEDSFVKQMSIVTLTRMKWPGAKALLEKLYKESAGELSLSDAVCWGLNELDGTNLPMQPIEPSKVTGWFLEYNK